jgi:uncharacterized protein (TIGR02594 family)
MTFKVVDSSLFVRRGPSLTEPAIAVLEEGDIVAQLSIAGTPTPILSETDIVALSKSAGAPKIWMKCDPGVQIGWSIVNTGNWRLEDDGSLTVVGAAGANVRAEPLPSAPIVATLPTGASAPLGPLVLEAQTANMRQWVRLDLGPKSGWASMLRLAPSGDAPQQTAEKFVVTAESLSVRATPSLEADVLGFLPRGAVVPAGAITQAEERNWMHVTNPADGFVSMKWLSKVGANPPPAGAFPWYEIAKQEVGVKEAQGGADNPRILEYFTYCRSLPVSMRHDSTSWCSAFVNFCVQKAGFEGTDSALARSWARWRNECNPPKLGCVVVLKSPLDPTDPVHGHVGLFVKQEGGRIYLLGGNQGNEVNISAFNQNLLISFRQP